MIVIRGLLFLTVAYLAAVADTSLADALQIGAAAPDFLLLAALWWVLGVAGPRAPLGAAALGLLSDLIAPGRVGLNVVAWGLAGYAADRFRERFRLLHPAALIATASAGAMVAMLLSGAGHWLLGETPLSVPAALGRAVAIAGYTAAVSVPVFLVTAWSREAAARRRQSTAP